jgi:hypothetical protein
MFMQELFLSWTQPSKTSCLFTIYQLYVLDWKRNILNLSMVMIWLMMMIDGWLTPLSTIYRTGQFYCNCVFYWETLFPHFNSVGPSWPWSYDNWIYNYPCNQYLSPLMLCVRISTRARCTTILWTWIGEY